MTTPRDNILSDISVLDLSQGVAGPFFAKLLAGWGAEVIKVEPPVTGDPTRSSEPLFGGSSALFSYINTTKKSVTLDPEIPEHSQASKTLAADCNILVESFPPGQMESLGLGYSALTEDNPGLIYVSVTPFGQTGPYSGYKGSDIVAQAAGALMHTIGLPHKEPAERLAGPVSD